MLLHVIEAASGNPQMTSHDVTVAAISIVGALVIAVGAGLVKMYGSVNRIDEKVDGIDGRLQRVETKIDSAAQLVRQSRR